MHYYSLSLREKLLQKQENENHNLIQKIQKLLKENLHFDMSFFEELNFIMKEKYRVFPHYDLEKRVIESKQVLMDIEQKLKLKVDNYLDLGCGHGFFPRAAFEMGKMSYGVDIESYAAWERYSENTNGRLQFLQCDFVTHKFHQLFQLITSFAAFEHFDKPDLILGSVAEKLKPQGVFYAKFSPIYNSCDGMHLYRDIAIPWYHLLFNESVILEFEKKYNIKKIGYLNKWSAIDYLLLFSSEKSLRLVEVRPIWDFQFLWFAKLFEAYFHHSFEELMCRGFEVIYQKSTSLDNKKRKSIFRT